jgi:hypothetical protein
MRKSTFRLLAIFIIGVALALSSIPAFAQSLTLFDFPGSISTVAYSINPSGAIAGYYDNGRDHSFVRTRR